MGRSGTIGFGLGNNLEMKIKTAKDTIERKVMLLNNFGLSTGYNIFADSFKLSAISMTAATNILDNTINLSLSANMDPYNYITITNEDGERVEKRIDSYAWKGGTPGRLTSANLGINTNLNPKKREKEKEKTEKIIEADMPEGDRQHLLQNPASYIDFEIPWSLNLGYTLSYSHPLNADPRIVQTVNMSGDLSISQKWKITYNTGYHFEEKEFTQTNLGISRDLHCWQMNLQWVPFGRFQSFNFVIAVKASILQDLKLERRKPFLDNL
jgi:hypothetical protein